jgi:DNA-binding transcriptional MerR regulator
MEKKGVTIQIAAEVLKVSVNTLRNWDKSGKLKARRAKNGYRYYHIRELEVFKQKHKK